MKNKIGFLLMFVLFLFVLTNNLHAQTTSNIDGFFNTGADPYSLNNIESEHFIIIYPEGWESEAKKTGIIAENAYIEVIDEVGYAPKGKIYIILKAYDEIANGSAMFILNTIRIYLNKPDFTSTIDTHLGDWLDKLITHELLHICHLGPNFLMGILPNFLIEGYAVYVESKLTSGGRVGSAIGDMYMRTSILYDDFPTIDKAVAYSDVITEWPLGGINYVFGGYFFQYLFETYGKEALQNFNKMNKENFPLPYWELNSIKAFGGKNFTQLWHNFKVWAEEKFTMQLEIINSEETKTGYSTNIGYSQTSIASSSGTDLIYFREYDPDSLPKLNSYNHENSEIKESQKLFLAKDFSLSKDGNLLVYNLKKSTSFYTHYLGDIYLYNLEKNSKKRLTYNKWASNPSISPDNDTIVYSKSNLGGSAIVLIDINSDGEVISDENIIIDGEREIEYKHPVFSNSGKYIAFIKADNECNRSIMIYDIEEKQIKEAISLKGIILSKISWAEDDSHLILSTDRNGIFNIYLYNFETEFLTRVSNFKTGAFNPIQKGDRIYFSYFTNNGYELRYISYTKAIELENEGKSWNYYDMIKNVEALEEPFSTGEIGLRDINSPSGYENDYPDNVSFTSESSYNPFLHLKFFYLLPDILLLDDGFRMDLITKFTDVNFRHSIIANFSFTFPYTAELTYFNGLGFSLTYKFDWYIIPKITFSTYPLLYSTATESYIGRTYSILFNIDLPLRGLFYDSYLIGLHNKLEYSDKSDIGGFNTILYIDIPLLMSAGRFITIRGFKPVSGFLMYFTPSFNIEFNTGKYVFSLINLYEINFPLFLPDGVTTLSLAIGYADPPTEGGFFITNDTFKLRSGAGNYVTGNKIISFSIDNSFRLCRIEKGLYPIPITLIGSYINLLFDVTGAIYGSIPENLSDVFKFGTGLELTIEFGIIDLFIIELTGFAYIDPINFDFNNPFSDPNTYNYGLRLGLNLPIDL